LIVGSNCRGKERVEGEWVENVVGLHDVKDAYAMLRTPDGEANIELIQFYRPTGEKDRERPLANTPGIRQIAGVGEDMESGVAKLIMQVEESVGWIETYEDMY